MKKFIFIVIVASLFFTLSCSPDDNLKSKAPSDSKEITWLSNIDNAINIAKKKDVPVFIHFTGSDWCGWCTKLKNEVYDHDSFIQYTKDNLVMVKLDYPRDIEQTEETKTYNREMLEKYEIQGFPTVLLLDSNGTLISKTGYKPGGPDEYIKHIKLLINSTK